MPALAHHREARQKQSIHHPFGMLSHVSDLVGFVARRTEKFLNSASPVEDRLPIVDCVAGSGGRDPFTDSAEYMGICKAVR